MASKPVPGRDNVNGPATSRKVKKPTPDNGSMNIARLEETQLVSESNRGIIFPVLDSEKTYPVKLDEFKKFSSMMDEYLHNSHLIVAEFEKISYNAFFKEFKKTFINSMVARAAEAEDRVLVYSNEEIHEIAHIMYDKIQLPKRSTSGSVGYDFFFPYDNTELPPDVQIIVPTGIKCKFNYPGYGLFLFPRSSYGFKHQMKIDNTIPVIDADYYNNEDNEGHIMVALTNQSNDNHSFTINFQDKYCQGIFLPIGYAVEEEVTGVRTGGIGSTGK